MKLFLRKYLFPCLLGLLIYILLFFFSKQNVSFFSYYLLICVLSGLLIRLIDDYADFEKDLKNKKIVFDKKILKLLIIFFSLINIILVNLAGAYLLIIILISFFISLIPYKILDYIKILYVPMLCLGVSYYYFGITIYSLILALISLVIDVVIIIRK